MDRSTACALALCLAAGVVLYRGSRLSSAADAKDTGAVTRAASVANGVVGLIGNTPLVRINSLSDATGCEILGKAEFLNPGGSSKDRIALYVIEQAEQKGLLVPHTNSCIFEGTSGSTGISLAMVARAKGYLCHIVMPSDQAIEKSQLLERHGATVERVAPCSIVDKNNFVNIARRLAQEYQDGRGYFVDQFENPLNFEAHYRTTGPEILKQTRGNVDAFVHGSGTGGTIAGVTWFLKQRVPGVRSYLADPQGSGLANKVNHGVMFANTEREGTRRRQQVDTLVEGVGLNRLTRNFARLLPQGASTMLDGAVSVSDADAVRMSRWLMANDGLFVGSSAAINCVAALSIARHLGPGHTVVTILADSGQRHLTKFWNDAAMTELGHSVVAPRSLNEFAQLLSA
ncbi:Cysteine synthase 2 [Coemansia sp. RSA 2337]|nr:Cysteine synthase 2 [Coemansia sp. S100]KAJ2351039.1 Cysteine synthase 2 [Coemansia sp. RSA 2673]KAJ2463917.1 Cysteine synthase 2 [Coemansia sp. RSA 2337]